MSLYIRILLFTSVWIEIVSITQELFYWDEYGIIIVLFTPELFSVYQRCVIYFKIYHLCGQYPIYIRIVQCGSGLCSGSLHLHEICSIHVKIVGFTSGPLV